MTVERNEFIGACRRGGAAMEAMMRSIDRLWAARLVRECSLVVRDIAVAEDIVQETLIKAWKNCAQFRGESELIGWLVSILRRCAIDHLRKKHPEESLDGPDGEPSHDVERKILELSGDQIPTPETALQRQQVADCLKRQGRKFVEESPLHATVMRWVAEDGLSNQEIGQLLDRSPGATREFISQARKKARIAYAPCHELALGVRGGSGTAGR